MSTLAQIDANRRNAHSSAGPRNAPILGLFTLADFVRPEEQTEHRIRCHSFWDDLHPTTPLQQTLAVEIIKATWRLRRCSLIEASSEGDTDPLQNEPTARDQVAVERARAHAHNIEITNQTQSAPAPTPPHR